MKRSTAVLTLFLAILLMAAFFTSCSPNTEVWRGQTMNGTSVLVEISKGYLTGDTVLVHRHDFVDVQPLTNTKVVLSTIALGY